jgi:hypothetical protein
LGKGAASLGGLGRLGRGLVERENDYHESHANDADKKCSPLPHCWTVPPEQLNGRAN